jgi:2-oxoglutarate dehydrogenase E2 component (dihydrolipoamide succinyltransferase)
MATEIRVPTLGESVTEATVGQWYKKVGDQVKADEPLVELETDKITLEVPAPAAGTIEAIEANNGATVGVGALLGRIGGVAAAAGSSAKADKATPAPTGKPDQKTDTTRPINAGPEQTKPREVPKAPAGPAPMAGAPSPAAAKILAEKGISPQSVQANGRDGRVTKNDAVTAMFAPPAASAQRVTVRAPSPPSDEAREQRVRMTRLRQTIARRLKEAQNAAAMLTRSTRPT